MEDVLDQAFEGGCPWRQHSKLWQPLAFLTSIWWFPCFSPNHKLCGDRSWVFYPPLRCDQVYGRMSSEVEAISSSWTLFTKYLFGIHATITFTTEILHTMSCIQQAVLARMSRAFYSSFHVDMCAKWTSYPLVVIAFYALTFPLLICLMLIFYWVYAIAMLYTCLSMRWLVDVVGPT